MDGWTHNKIIILYLFDFHFRNSMEIVSFFQYMKTGAEELWRYLPFVLDEVKKLVIFFFQRENKRFPTCSCKKENILDIKIGWTLS